MNESVDGLEEQTLPDEEESLDELRKEIHQVNAEIEKYGINIERLKALCLEKGIFVKYNKYISDDHTGSNANASEDSDDSGSSRPPRSPPPLPPLPPYPPAPRKAQYPLVDNKYRINRKIRSGGCGDVYLGTNIISGEEIAIKLEPVETKHPQLNYEARVYKSLAGGIGIPRAIWFGTWGEHNAMGLDLLGSSLEDLFNFCSRKFSLKTVLLLAD
ncbi:hypothetical protein VE03_10288 [Pseudogymnoascus sp. 23342-1-I1]|nr:hypothetical protein VE03_10288 [Pseudogymnoascus sp. 23342-1-I1]